MLTIKIPTTELWDEGRSEFIAIQETELRLEHSLVAISKWESKWKKPFLTRDPKTEEETRDYVRCMSVDDIDPLVFSFLTQNHLNQISSYIEDPMTATWFKEDHSKPSKQIITSERIYYWMCAAQIPFECQYWHLNRLMTLIRIASIESQPAKKMGKKDIYSQNAALNKARRAKHKSKG